MSKALLALSQDFKEVLAARPVIRVIRVNDAKVVSYHSLDFGAHTVQSGHVLFQSVESSYSFSFDQKTPMPAYRFLEITALAGAQVYSQDFLNLLGIVRFDSVTCLWWAALFHFNKCQDSWDKTTSQILDPLLASLATIERIGESDKKPTGELPPTNKKDDAPLSVKQREILESLLELKAISSDARCTTQELSQKSAGQHANPETFKQPIADLKQKGLVDTRKGPGGGVWLTDQGLIRAQLVSKK